MIEQIKQELELLLVDKKKISGQKNEAFELLEETKKQAGKIEGTISKIQESENKIIAKEEKLRNAIEILETMGGI